MLWFCRDCGIEVSAEDPVLVVTIGWTSLDGDSGLCPICNRPDKGTSRPLIRASRTRVEQTFRQLAATREMIRRRRG